MKEILGIDVGGSGIKGAIVNLKKGELATERIRLITPTPPAPEQIADTISELVQKFKWKGKIGIGFPAVIKNGVVHTAANIDKSFIGLNFQKILEEKTKCPVLLVNDADAAGVAEMKYGAGNNVKGMVIMITIGTGIGTALFNNGKLIANTELGHIYMPNHIEAEQYASDAVRQNQNLSWTEWATRINQYLIYIENLFWPDLFIIGGGVSKHKEKFFSVLTTRTPTVTATLLNNAGIIGAAYLANKWL